MIAAVSAPAASSPTTPAPPNRPAPLPASLPFSDSSALASAISWRTSVDVSAESFLKSSPNERVVQVRSSVLKRSWSSSPARVGRAGLAR